MDLLSDLLSFICAVVNSWAGYATGGVIMALVAFWAMFRQKQVPRSMGLGLPSFFFSLRSFMRGGINIMQRFRHKKTSERQKNN